MGEIGSVTLAATRIAEAFRGLGTGVCVCEADGTVRYANDTLFALMGTGAGARDMTTASDISEELGNVLAEALRNTHVRRQIAVTDAAGAMHPLICRAVAVDDGSAAVIILDAPQGNGESVDGRHAVLDSLEDGYYESDLEGCMTWVNGGFLRISGYDRGEVVGRKYDMFFDAEGSRRIYQLFNEVFTTGTPSKLTNWIFIDKSGRKKNLESSISPMRDAVGKIVGFQGIIRDLTERNKMERELMRARKLEAIGILAGGIAHDYNNALTAILGNISLAKMETTADNRNLAEVLNDAEEASLRAVELTRRLSTFARGGKPERKPADLGELLQSMADPVLNGYAGTYEIRLQEGLWPVEIDEFQIGQVVTYLLENAIESMREPGRILIEARNEVIEREESHHELSIQPGNYVMVSITDEGEGIPPEHIPSIFDPYFTTRDMASGMGLATSYAIIKRHHGYIDVKSTVGVGTTFFFYLSAISV